jgi:LysR family nitrogen assimilation transcriptional regulator
MPLAYLAELPLIVPSRPNAFRLLIETEMLRVNCKPNIVLEIDGLNAILELVKEGLGYAVLPPYTLRNFGTTHDFTTHRIETPKLTSQLMLVWSARRPMTATLKAAMQVMQDEVAKAMT